MFLFVNIYKKVEENYYENGDEDDCQKSVKNYFHLTPKIGSLWVGGDVEGDVGGVPNLGPNSKLFCCFLLTPPLSVCVSVLVFVCMLSMFLCLFCLCVCVIMYVNV